MVRYVATATGLVVYLMLAWFLGSFLGLQGNDLWLFRIGLGLIGLMAAATCAWYIHRREQQSQQEASTPPSDTRSSGKVDSRLRDAALVLKERHLKPLSRFPVLLVLGEPESGKTTTVVKSGMRPELLAGKDYSGPDVVATESLNCWLVEGAIVIEPALAVQSVPSEWGSLIKRVTLRRLSGAPGPLAVLVCFPANGLGGSRDSVVAAARKLRAQLGSLAQAAERKIPIYVIFTKLDLVKTFKEYIARFTDSEIDQLLGAPMPLVVDSNRNMHSDRIAKAVASRFDRLVAGLARTRIDLLQRQREMKIDSDPKTLASIYEFPREFKRIRDNTVQFLTELFIPGTTSFGPFLRGFYFCGARLNPGSQPVMETPTFGRDLSATVIVRSPSIEGRSTFPSSFRAGSASDQQWTFLGPIFDEILNDRQAAEVSQSEVGMSVRRKVLLGVAGSLVLLLFIGMTVSFLRNHDLIAKVKKDAVELNAPGGDFAVQMAALDSLSKEIQGLDGYSTGAPWSLRWGLYAGDKAREGGQKVYFHWFEGLLMDEVRSGIRTSVASVGPTPGPSDFQDGYNALKAYLMLTSETSDRDKVDPDFLAPYLLQRWIGGAHSSPSERDLAKSQFEFFAAKLKSESSLAKKRDDAMVDRARNYLRAFGSGGRLYQLMLAEAEKSGTSVRFAKTDVLTVSHVVPATYTKPGWDVMQNALKDPQRLSASEQWVLGEAPRQQFGLSDTEAFRQRYLQEYISQWQDFVKSADIGKFNDLQDAASKLRTLTESSSPLLKFLILASDNTSQDSMELKGVFQVVQSLVKPNSPNDFVGPAYKEYMNALYQLSNLHREKSKAYLPDSQNQDDLKEALNGALNDAANGTAKARQAGQARGVNQGGQLEKTVVTLLERPIRMTAELLQKERLKGVTPK